MAVSVIDLCGVYFTNRPPEQQVQIVALGRPLPLKLFSEASKNTQKHITPLLFEQVQWLTYYEEWKEFFCWPCLLFMPHFIYSKLKVKATAGFRDILTATKIHENTEDHLRCSLKLQMFIAQNFEPPVSEQNKVGHNHAVKKNREILKCIIDAVCCVIGQKHLDSDGKYSFNIMTLKDCKNFLHLLKDCHPRKVDVVDAAVELLSSNPRIINTLVDAMTRSVKMSIKNETQKSSYVSIILSQHGSSGMKSQISTILRYINGGKVFERFIGFTNNVGIKTRDQLMQNILRPIEEYGISERFLALSLDGEISCGHSLSILIETISATYPFSYFVPWYSHGFAYVLLQTLSIYKEYGVFLKMIAGMQDFFRNEKLFKSLDVLLRQKIPNYNSLSAYKWNLHYNFVLYVAKYRCYFIEFFGNVICNSRCQKDGIVAQAMAYQSFLREFSNVFLLKLLYEIFSDNFDQNFNFPLESYAFNYDRIFQFKTKVEQVNFATIQQALEAERENDGTFKSGLQWEVANCFFMFQTMIKHLCNEIETRCLHLSSRLSFCNLFDALHDCPMHILAKSFNTNSDFHRLQRQMIMEHGQFFQDHDLRVEMEAIKSNSSICEMTVPELLEHFAKYNLRPVFPQSYKLVELILTLPYLPASCQTGGVSKLEDIRKFSYFPEVSGIPSGELSFLNIECELLRSLRQSPAFYDDVLARLYEVNKTIPLVQI